MLCNGVDLLDFWRGTLSPRRLWVLIKNLPAKDSLFVRVAAPDKAEVAQWGPTDYLLADMFDVTANAHFRRPKPYPRPADQIATRQRDEQRHHALLAQHQRIKAASEEGT